jgi:MFS family permease
MSRSRTSIPHTVVVLGIVSYLTDAASEMIYPLIPVFVASLGSGALVLGVIEGIAETTASLLKLVSGVISDKLGRRKVLILIGYGLSSIVRPFTGAVTAAWQIVLVRLLDRVGKGVRTAPRDALIAASVDSGIRGKAYGFHRAMDHAGAVTGPLLAIVALAVLVLGYGITDTLTALRWTFGLAIVPGLCAILTIVFFVKEQRSNIPAAGTFRFLFRSFDRNFLSYLAIVTLFTLGNSSDAFLLFRAREILHSSESLHAFIMGMPLLGDMVSRFGDTASQQQMTDILFLPFIWSFFHVIKVAFSTWLGALSDRIGRKRVITIGWGIYAVVYFAFAFLDRLPADIRIVSTFVLFAVYALFYAFTEGAEKALVADIVKPDVLGSAFGMFNFAIGIGSLPASIVFGILYQSLGATVAFGTGAIVACMSMLLLAMFVVENRPESTPF